MSAPAMLLLLLGIGAASAAPPVRDPNWPCQQIKTPELSPGAVWSGPDLTGVMQSWSRDPAVAALVQDIARRRVPIEDAKAALRAFADAAGAARREKLLAVAAGLFQILDAERAQVVAGLDRFGLRQKQLAAEIRADMAKLRAEEPAGNTVAPASPSAASDRLNLEIRLFEQRRQEVSAACDVPNRIEQRLYALEQVVQSLLD